MDSEDRRIYNNAKILAGLSYLGIILPLAGWILGGISCSLINSINEPKTLLNQGRLQHVKNVATGGIIISTLIAVGIGLLVSSAYHHSQQPQDNQTASSNCFNQAVKGRDAYIARNGDSALNWTIANDNLQHDYANCSQLYPL